MTKLIIWDLDDTLWQGTLAEGDKVVPIANRVEAVRRLNRCGVVNAICSKNDFETARAQLAAFGLWDEFVFPTIEFSPKGPLVRQIIEDMQLRAPDVVFVDDNAVNLAEVAHFNDGIQVCDAREPSFDEFLQSLLTRLAGVSKSRVEEYRILERKRADRTQLGAPDDVFLASCEIRVALLRRTDNLPWASRIEELINRTNQLNFTKSRVPEGSLPEYLIDLAHNETYAVFVWDRYGDYGLVGFAAVEDKVRLRHFLFSCRTMNMGVESAVAWVLSKTFRTLALPVPAQRPSWIEIVDAESEAFREMVDRLRPASGRPGVRVMANCQSGAIAHYMKRRDVAFDNWPRVFKLEEALSGKLPVDAPELVYGAFVDYDNRYWTTPPTAARMREAAGALLDSVVRNGQRIAVILPPSRFQREWPKLGVTCKRFTAFNAIWRELARSSDRVQLIELDDPAYGFASPDPRHFERDVLRRIAEAATALLAQPQDAGVS